MASAILVLSNRLKTALAKQQIDFSAHAFKACLARAGFVFNPDLHRTRANFKGSLSASLIFLGSTISGTGFSVAGFVSGQVLSISGTTLNNNASVTLKSATDSVLYFLESFASGTSVANLNIVDEYASLYGYSQDAAFLSGVVIGEDLTNDWVSVWWSINLSWTISGGSLGPLSGMIIIDDTASVIVGYVSFTSAELIASGNALVVNGVTIRIA
jgi:hypothetical protein